MTRQEQFLFAEDTAAFGLLIGQVENTARRLREQAGVIAVDQREAFGRGECADLDKIGVAAEDQAIALSALELQLARATDALPRIPSAQLPITQEAGAEDEDACTCMIENRAPQRADAASAQIGDLVEVPESLNELWCGVWPVTGWRVSINHSSHGEGWFPADACYLVSRANGEKA